MNVLTSAADTAGGHCKRSKENIRLLNSIKGVDVFIVYILNININNAY